MVEPHNLCEMSDAAKICPSLPCNVEDSCHARVGLMGNPSDGFGGKTLSFLIENFKATVRIEEKSADQGVEISEPVFFQSLDDLAHHSTKIGYTSGLRLLQATCKVFTNFCVSKELTVHLQRGFKMTYETNIPRMVGLSGSSAIIVAAFRALLKFHSLSIAQLGISREMFPQVILNIEKQELGISAGLQDRVIQTFGGLVHMDFTPRGSIFTWERSGSQVVPAAGTGSTAENVPPVEFEYSYSGDLVPSSTTTTTTTTTSATGSATGSAAVGNESPYTSLDPSLLPEMYLAYDTTAGGDSGAVHSTVKSRWLERDPELVAGMALLAGLADEAVLCLQRGDKAALAGLMEQNFNTRLRLYGPDVVGRKNKLMVELSASLQMSAKFTGSGGALVCLRRDGKGWWSAEEEANIRDQYASHGFAFERIIIPDSTQHGSSA